LRLLAPCRSERIKIWPVGKRIGNVRNNGPDLIDPVADAEEGTPATALEVGRVAAGASAQCTGSGQVRLT
jgi:hypothetical protein